MHFFEEIRVGHVVGGGECVQIDDDERPVDDRVERVDEVQHHLVTSPITTANCARLSL